MHDLMKRMRTGAESMISAAQTSAVMFEVITLLAPIWMELKLDY